MRDAPPNRSALAAAFFAFDFAAFFESFFEEGFFASLSLRPFDDFFDFFAIAPGIIFVGSILTATQRHTRREITSKQ